MLQINLIGWWFNYINRVADGLGVGLGRASSARQPTPHLGHKSARYKYL